jgi:hypothetical protein
MWLLKLDSSGNKQWEQGLSDSYLNLGEVVSVVQANDDGYVLVGGLVFSASHIVKTDSVGNVQWKQAYSDISLSSIVKTSDNGYAIAGTFRNSSVGDFWLAKINSNGVTQWTQTYGGSNDDFCRSVVQTVDGGYALVGSTNSFGAGNSDMLLVKTDSSGTITWNQTYGTQEDDAANSFRQTSDNGYLLVGYGNHDSDNPVQNYALWLVKADSSGKMVWNQTYNQFGDNLHTSVITTKDGGYAIADNSGLIKTDSSGRLQWSLPHDGTFALVQKDSDYVFAGSVIGSSPNGGWIASTAAMTTPDSTTPAATQSPSASPTSPPLPVPTQFTNPFSALDFVKFNYWLIIAVIAFIVVLAVLIFETQKRKQKKT